MADLFDPDFQEFIRLLNKNEVKYSLVGGYAVIIHGHVRYKGDINLWAEATDKNYLRLIKTFQAFRMPLFGMTKQKFL